MANPQKENGYTAISNEILEAIIKYKLNATQFRIVLLVWRSTYGWNKKEYVLSESYISNATDIHKQQVKRELKKLIELNILTVIKDATYTTGRLFAFNKNFESWVEVTKKLPGSVLATTGGSELVTTGGSVLATQKRNNKRNNKNNNMFFEIYNFYLSLGLKKHKKYTDAMRNAIKRAMEQNKYSVEECKELLQRHNRVVELTKDKGKYAVRLRGLDEFFGQKVTNGKHLICSEYEEGGKKYDEYLNANLKDNKTELEEWMNEQESI